jgi:hypothetical protein
MANPSPCRGARVLEIALEGFGMQGADLFPGNGDATLLRATPRSSIQPHVPGARSSQSRSSRPAEPGQGFFPARLEACHAIRCRRHPTATSSAAASINPRTATGSPSRSIAGSASRARNIITMRCARPGRSSRGTGDVQQVQLGVGHVRPLRRRCWVECVRYGRGHHGRACGLNSRVMPAAPSAMQPMPLRSHGGREC